MDKVPTLFVAAVLACCWPIAMAGGWGPTFAIELRGDGFEQPLVITDPSIVKKLSFWVGPGTNMTDFMCPDGAEKSIVDWDAGVVTDRPAGLRRIEVKFRVGWSPESKDAYFVLYEIEPGGSKGYIYHPGTNAIVAHVRHGTWRRASDRWNEVIGAIVNKHMTVGAEGEFTYQSRWCPDGCWPDRLEPSD